MRRLLAAFVMLCTLLVLSSGSTVAEEVAPSATLDGDTLVVDAAEANRHPRVL